MKPIEFLRRFKLAYGKDFGLGRITYLKNNMQVFGYFPRWTEEVTHSDLAWWLVSLCAIDKPHDKEYCKEILDLMKYEREEKPLPAPALIKRLESLLSDPDELKKIKCIHIVADTGAWVQAVIYFNPPDRRGCEIFGMSSDVFLQDVKRVIVLSGRFLHNVADMISKPQNHINNNGTVFETKTPASVEGGAT